MRFAYVGNFDPPHSTENHVAKAAENLGHSVTRIPEQRLEWLELPNLVNDHDLMLWTRTGAFEPPDQERQRTALRAVTIPKVGYHLDRWWGLARQDTEMGPTSPNPSCFFTELDLLCTADGGNHPWAVRHEWMPPAILSDEMTPAEPMQRYAVDVAFVGNLEDYGHAEWKGYRHELWGALTNHYGRRFRSFPGRGRPAIRGRELAALYASTKVNVGDSCLVGNPPRYWSDRIPETLGRGGYLIHPEVEGLSDEYPHLLTYPLGDFDRLLRMIDAALADPVMRHAMVEMNRDWVRDHHTYEHRLRRLLELI